LCLECYVITDIFLLFGEKHFHRCHERRLLAVVVASQQLELFFIFFLENYRLFVAGEKRNTQSSRGCEMEMSKARSTKIDKAMPVA
jgi:hypothetical protein